MSSTQPQDQNQPEAVRRTATVWDAIAHRPEEAANLRLRCELITQIVALIEAQDWTQADAATRCGVTLYRMNDLLRGRASRFTLDALVIIAAALGQRVHVELRGPDHCGQE